MKEIIKDCLFYAKRAVSSTFQRSFGWNGARSSLIRAHSSSTVPVSTVPASPCFRISLSRYLLKCESRSYQFKAHSRATERLNPPRFTKPFIFWNIKFLLEHCPLCNEHPTLTTSRFCSMCWTHSHNARSTSGLVTMRSRLLDSALGTEVMRTSISDRCCNLRDSVDWVNTNAPSGLVAKNFTTSPWLTGWGRVSTCA